jgi:hypothetical protein
MAQPKKESTIAKISINFPKELWKDLKRQALEDDETVTAILVRLTQKYLASKRPSRKSPEGPRKNG